MDGIGEVKEKYAALLSELRKTEKLAVAFSGGVDSTFLLRAAKEAGLKRLMALTIDCISVPRREIAETESFCHREGIEYQRIAADQLAIDGFAGNPPERCYLCKKELFSRMKTIAQDQGIERIAEGSNTDDEGDYRPGMRAIRELGIESPLKEAGLSKQDIRILSKELKLSTWDKPALACLSTRIATGELITAEKLKRIEEAEDFLADAGFTQFRVRMHGSELARIEVKPEELKQLMEKREEITDRLHAAGFRYVSVDLDGYRMGSMNPEVKR